MSRDLAFTGTISFISVTNIMSVKTVPLFSKYYSLLALLTQVSLKSQKLVWLFHFIQSLLPLQGLKKYICFSFMGAIFNAQFDRTKTVQNVFGNLRSLSSLSCVQQLYEYMHIRPQL